MYVIRGYIIAQYFLSAATPRMFEKPPSFLFKVKINEDNVNISIHGKMDKYENPPTRSSVTISGPCPRTNQNNPR